MDQNKISIFTEDGKKIAEGIGAISFVDPQGNAAPKSVDLISVPKSTGWRTTAHGVVDSIKPNEGFLKALEEMRREEEKQYRLLWKSIENIIRKHTGEPLLGEITKEEVMSRNIRGILFDEQTHQEEITTDGCVKISLEHNFIGVVQGEEVIHIDGSRSPLSRAMEDQLSKCTYSLRC